MFFKAVGLNTHRFIGLFILKKERKKKDGQNLRSHLAQGVQLIVHLFATSRQLVVTLWNTVLRRILRLSLSLPEVENAVTDSGICCGRKGPLLLKCHVFYISGVVHR